MIDRLRHCGAAAAVLIVVVGATQSAYSFGTDPIMTVAGNGVRGSVDGGQATEAALDRPRSIFATADGGFVWAQPYTNTVRKVGPDGIVTTIAGSGAAGFSGDGGQATTANLNFVHGAAPTADGGYLLADTRNDRIRKVGVNGTITTVAGTGVPGYSGDGGAATSAQINRPRGVAALSDGGFLIPDTDNDRVRRVWPNGTITTVAGTGVQGFSGDGGPATLAQLANPFGVAATADGGFLVVDIGNNRIRKVAAGGMITTVAGNGVGGYSGDGGLATAASLLGPANVATLGDGGFLIADGGNHRVRLVDAQGVIQTIAGTGVAGFSGDGGPATAAQLATPKAVGLTAAGDVLIADEENDRIRFVGTPVAPVNVSSPTVSGLAAVPGTLHGAAGGWSGTGPTFTYQWRRCDSAGANCADVFGATASTYVLTSTDVGSTMRVNVTASNAASSASAESAQTGVVSASTGQPLFVSSASASFNASSFTIPTPAGAVAGDLLVSWLATDSTHSIGSVPSGWTQLGTTQNDGSDSSVSAFWRVLQPGDPASFVGSFVGGEAGSLGVLAYRGVNQTAPIEVFAQRGTSSTTATITPQGDGRMIVALFGGDPGANPRTGTPDSSPPASERLDAQNGTFGVVYAEDYLQQSAAPVALDVTWNSFEGVASYIVSLSGSSAPTPPSNTSLPTISGQAEQGQTLTAATGIWSGSQPISYAYQWRRCDSAGANCADVFGATASTYALTSTDVGSTMRVNVTASNAASSASAESAQTAVVSGLTPPSNTSLPTISGQAEQGQTLTAATGIWSGSQPISYAYQWRRCDSAGANCADVFGATASTYALTSTDVGSTMRVNVTASNAASSASAESAQTAVVSGLTPPSNTSLPTISGQAEQGQTLTAATGIWSGSQPISYAYQWRRCDSAGANCANVFGATASTYVLTSTDVGSTMRVNVTASNAASSASAESAQTGVVSASTGQPLFVSSASASFNASSFTIPTPAGAVAGDLLVSWLATDSTHSIGSVPSGWTQLGTTQNDGSDSSVSAFWRVLQPGDPASFVGSFVGGEAGSLGVLAYRGVNQTAPIEVFAQRGTSSTTATITPQGDGRMIVALFGGDPGANPRTGTPDSSPPASERLDAQNGTFGVVYAEDYLQQSAAPVALDVTWNAGETAASFVLALKGP